MRKLSISHRLTLIVLLSLLSVLFLGNLFVSQSLKEISFADRELSGVEVLAPLLEDLSRVARGESPARLADLEALTAASPQLDLGAQMTALRGAAVAGAAALGAAAAYGPYYRPACGYYPYPPCY